MNGKTILILGAGVGGITTANQLRDRLAPKHRVVLVDRQTDFVFGGSLLWVMRGWRRPEQISKPLYRMVRRDVELIEAEIEEIEPKRGTVRTTRGDLNYDYLVVAVGASLAPDVVPGFSEAAYTPYELNGAVLLSQAVRRFEGGRLAILVASTPYKCPAAPYEMAMLLDDHLRRTRLRARCELELFTPETLPMGVAGPEMGKAVVQMLADRDIAFNSGAKLSLIEVERRELVFANRESTGFDLLAAVPPHEAPRVVRESPLAGDTGWIPVERRTLRTQFENVYAIGDVAAVSLANGKPLPKAGVFAEGEGKAVAGRIVDEVEHRASEEEFDGRGFCWIETGRGSAGFAGGEFYAEPDPVVPLPRSGRIWHWGKAAFEKYWLSEGLTRIAARAALRFGSKVLGVGAPL